MSSPPHHPATSGDPAQPTGPADASSPARRTPETTSRRTGSSRRTEIPASGHHRRRTGLLAGLAAASLLALTACGTAGTATTAGAAHAQSDHPSDVITYGHQQEPPCVYGGWIEQGYLSHQVLDSLVSLGDDGTVEPWLATSWDVADDDLAWTFHLREDPTFSDGTPVDAQAIVDNIDYWLSGGNSTALVWLDSYVESATAVDEHTVRIDLAAPYPRLAENLTQPYFGIQSPSALATRSAEENCTAPIGSGPFTVTEWNRGSNIILDRRDDYDWAPATAAVDGPARPERIDWKFLPDPTARTAALRAGALDAIYDVQAFEWENLQDEGFGTLLYNTPGRPQQISFNTTRAPFDDQRVRQAFAYSLDREAVVDTVGHGVIPYEGNGPVSQATDAYSQEAADRYTHDPDEANRLLDEAGWTDRADDGTRVKDGERLHVEFPYAAGRTINQDGAAIIQGVARYAQDVGFDVELIPFPPSEAAAGAYTTPDEYDLSIGYWTSINAGILLVNWQQEVGGEPNKSNSAFWFDEDLEDLIRDANSATVPEEQDALYREAQEYIADNALSIGVYDRLSTLAINPRLHGVRQENSQGGPVFHDAYID